MPKKSILLVEDNPDDETLIIRSLRRYGVLNEINVARDGVEALAYLLGTESNEENGTRPLPIVVVLDLKLPKLDGLEVLRRLRAEPRTRLLPIVILTSSTQETDIIKSYELGANSYVAKPVEFEQFAEAVRQLGLYWLLLNRPPH